MGKTITHEVAIHHKSLKTQEPIAAGTSMILYLSFKPSNRDPMYGLKIKSPYGRSFLVTRIRPPQLESTIEYVSTLYCKDGAGGRIEKIIRRLLKTGFAQSTKSNWDRYH